VSDIEGEVTRVGASEPRQRTSFKTSRYAGKAKVDLQNQFVGAACNVKRWLRLLAQQSLRMERSQSRGEEETIVSKVGTDPNFTNFQFFCRFEFHSFFVGLCVAGRFGGRLLPAGVDLLLCEFQIVLGESPVGL
jgi:hypothetical protein